MGSGAARVPIPLEPSKVRIWPLALGVALPTEVFEWYQVGKEVNKTGNNEKHLIEPACA